MSSFDGTGDFVHVTCWDKDFEVTMQQKRDEFEQEILDNNTTVLT
jgi:membrane-bound inhibitor of C-type lysozyme